MLYIDSTFVTTSLPNIIPEPTTELEITQDFPNGAYVYHATVDADNNPIFPYFIGNTFRSKKESFKCIRNRTVR